MDAHKLYENHGFGSNPISQMSEDENMHEG